MIDRNDYYESDFMNPDVVIIRPKENQKRKPFVYCKWAAQDWEARFYAGTPTHKKQCEDHIKQLVNNPSWYNCKVGKAGKVNKKAAIRSNAKGDGAKGGGKNAKGKNVKDNKTQDWIT